MEKIILSIDCGTQSTRAMLFNDKGELLAKCRESYDEPYFSPSDGYAEQDADFYFEKLCLAVKALKAENSALWGSIIGVTIACMRDVGVCLDKDMHPLRPAILWLDKRKAACREPLPLKSRFLFFISGMTDAVAKNRVDCKSNWIKENEPDVFKNTYKYAELSAYLNYLLTGKLINSVASMIGHLPMNYKKRTFMSDRHFQMPIFKMPRSMFYKLVEPGEIIGEITPAASELTGIPRGLPLVASGSDKGCETIGTGVIYEGIASLSFGTTATIQITTEKYVEPITFLPAYPAVYPNRYNPEIMVNRGYWTLTWFIHEFIKKDGSDNICYEKLLDKHLCDVPPLSEGLYVDPFWNPSLKYPHARGSMIGFTERHGKYHMYRAIIEGINYALMKGAESLEKKSKTKLKALTASGGGAKSDEVLQITADMFGLPVRRAQTYETSGLGAAICAFVGLKIFADYDTAIKNMVRIEKEFVPDMKKHALYKDFYSRIYKKTYKRLKPIYKELKKPSGTPDKNK